MTWLNLLKSGDEVAIIDHCGYLPQVVEVERFRGKTIDVAGMKFSSTTGLSVPVSQRLELQPATDEYRHQSQMMDIAYRLQEEVAWFKVKPQTLEAISVLLEADS